MSDHRQREKFYGWRVVAAAFVLATFGWGIGFYSPAIFLQTLHEVRGWPVTLISAAVTVHFLAGALVVANLPRLYRRLGVPLVTTGGAIALALGVLGWAHATAPWQLFAATIFSGGGWVAMGAAAVNAIISPWFVRARPAALASAYNGASVGGIIFAPLWVTLIAWIGFAHAALVVGIIMTFAIAGLSRLVFTRTPEGMGQAPDGEAPGVTVRSVTAPDARPLPGGLLWRDRKFITLALGMALSLFAQIGLLAHLFSLLVPALGAQNAGYAMALATAAAIGGRTLVGWLMPAGADRRLVISASIAVQCLGVLALFLAAGTSVPLLLIGVVMVGAGIGNATSLPPLIAQVEFVKEEVPRVVSLIVALGQATYAFAPLAFALMREAFDIDAAVQGAASGMLLAAAAIETLAIAAYIAGRGGRRSRRN